MPGNAFGKLFRITTFGESHGPAIGVVIDGCPPGLEIDMDFLQLQLRRRRPGQSRITSQRKEEDIPEILSGIFEGRSTGTPIAMLIRNADSRSDDYAHLREAYRPSHADYTYDAKYGFRDYRGGGRASARETAARVAAGAIAMMLLRREKIEIRAYVRSVGELTLQKEYAVQDLGTVDDTIVRCPDPELAEAMIRYIAEIRKQGDTVGGTVRCVVQNCPAGLGDPVFNKLHAELGKAMFSINAVKGVEFGSGFGGTKMRGSEHNDIFDTDPATHQVITRTNHSGGIQGGISNGMEIYFTVAFKPVATILRPQESINREGEKIILEGRGRHDPCVVPRAVPIVESMCALVLADQLLLQRAYGNPA